MILIKRNLLEGSSNYALQMGSLIGANKLFRNKLIEKGKKGFLGKILGRQFEFCFRINKTEKLQKKMSI